MVTNMKTCDFCGFAEATSTIEIEDISWEVCEMCEALEEN